MSWVGIDDAKTIAAYCVVQTCLIPVLSRLAGVPVFAPEKKLSPREARARSWLPSLTVSFTVSTLSMPVVSRLLLARFDVATLDSQSKLCRTIMLVFAGYLVYDIVVGLLYYRRQVNLVTGWIHHSLYLVLSIALLRNDWCHVFALAASMEVPTFILALGSVWPRLRSDYMFASTFFVLRIVFHIALIGLYSTPYGRSVGPRGVNAPEPSFVPALCLTAAFPMHAFWFYKCVRGIRRRRAAASRAAAEAGTPVPPKPQRLRLSSQWLQQTLQQRPRIAPLRLATGGVLSRGAWPRGTWARGTWRRESWRQPIFRDSGAIRA